MLRTNTCGELRLDDVNKEVTLCGWVQKSRDLGGMTFIDLRDRYGITQLVFNLDWDSNLCKQARALGREFVLQITGTVIERESKNKNTPSGDIEIKVRILTILNSSLTPPFTIEDETDGGDELRMKYRYLDLRRTAIRKNLELRHRIAIETRNYLDKLNFIEVETPVLIKSTPEGARDFVVPSRMNKNQFYALPQSPQTFKQLLMVSGFDRYYQIVKCFRDEDLRADRQPEFTQIDCEMSFVDQDDILNTFEGLLVYLFKIVKNIDIPKIPRMSYAQAMKDYGSDKPDTRFEMKLINLNSVCKGKNFSLFNEAELIIGLCATGAAEYTRKQLDELTEWVKRPQIGASGLVYVRYQNDGAIKSSVDKFYSEEDLKKWVEVCDAKKGDIILVLAGNKNEIRKAASELRLELGNRLGLRDKNKFSCLWVIDFPLIEWNEDDPNLLSSLSGRWHAKHHPFTSPKNEDMYIINSMISEIREEIIKDMPMNFKVQIPRAKAYDIVINGVEIGGGSVRIHNKDLQEKMFEILGFSKEEAQKQFGFLMNAFEFGAPPHGGIALGFDRLCSIFGGNDSIRDFIAFPKNNSGRDVMIDAPNEISAEQLYELEIELKKQS